MRKIDSGSCCGYGSRRTRYMNFDPDRALEYARRLSYPRAVGTPGEAAAAETISGWFSDGGYEVSRQKFQFYNALDRAIKLEVGLGQLLILAGLIGGWINPGIEIFPAGFLLLILVSAPAFQRRVLDASILDPKNGGSKWWSLLAQRLGDRHTGANLIASLPTRDRKNTLPHLILMAHYDTKSQTISLPLRMVLLVLMISGAIAYGLFTLLDLIHPGAGGTAMVAGGVAILSGIPLLLLRSENKSPGALDNASGIGLLVHLAEVFGSHPAIHQKIRITFVASDAEEHALMGARAYLLSILDSPHPDGQRSSLFVLNFDGVGGDGQVNLSGVQRLESDVHLGLGHLLQDCCRKETIANSRYPLPGLMMDHMPFARAGLEAVSLTNLSRNALVIHTSHDGADNLSTRGMDQAGRAAICLVGQLTGDPRVPILVGKNG